MTDLPHVSDGDPHAPAHNAERDAINALQDDMPNKISLPPGAATGDLLRWDGTTWLTTETRFFEGNGNPNGVLAAPVGSRYIDKAATLGAVEWIKSTGTGNTGWFTLAGDSGWIQVGATDAAPFQNGFVNYGSSWTTAAYRKLNGVTHLKGLLNKTTGSRALVMFSLPVGFRPSADTHIKAHAGAVTVDQAAVNILKNGDVKGRPTTPGLYSLDGISFPADN